MSSNREPYFEIEAVSNSYLSTVMGGRPISEANAGWGSLFHKCVLEPQKLTGDDKRHKKYSDSMRMATVAKEHGLVMAFLTNPSTRIEHEVYRTMWGIKCKCKFDGLNKPLGMGLELKSTSSYTDKDFVRAIEMFDYDRAAFHYMELGGTDTHIMFGVQKQARHGYPLQCFVHIIKRGDQYFESGRIKHEAAIKKLKEQQAQQDEERQKQELIQALKQAIQ